VSTSSATEANDDLAILTAIVKRFVRLLGMNGALKVARRVPGLMVDDEGNVVAYDGTSPFGAVTQLIDEFSIVIGSSAATLAHTVMQPLATTLETKPVTESSEPVAP
jgi:hypothetical protein